jgi:hypothetical protein
MTTASLKVSAHMWKFVLTTTTPGEILRSWSSTLGMVEFVLTQPPSQRSLTDLSISSASSTIHQKHAAPRPTATSNVNAIPAATPATLFTVNEPKEPQ